MRRKKPFMIGLILHYILFPPKDKVKKEHTFLSIPYDLFRKKWFEIMDKIFMLKFHFHLKRLLTTSMGVKLKCQNGS
jgi:hypothetical protein